MNSRERLELALNHKEADTIPSDLGGTVLTSINHDLYRRLRIAAWSADWNGTPR